MGSGKSGGGGSGMNDYFGDIAGVICAGPIDRLVAIYVDSKKVWPESGTGLDRAGQPNPVQITITGFGAAWLYWGTDDQTLDSGWNDAVYTKKRKFTGERVLEQNGHPPYRRQAVLVLQDFLFGRERTSAPSVECVVRRTPSQALITGPAAALDAEGQANPLACLAELLTHPVFGLGLPATDFDLTSWQATADALYAKAATTYISPIFDRPASARSLVDDLRGYFDGWFRADTAAKIVAGRFLHGEAAPTFDSTNTLTADDLLEEPSITSKGWAETLNELAVKFQDADNEFKDSAFTLSSGYNRQLTGEPRQSNFERPHVTRRAQIASLAGEFLKLSAEPGFTAKLRVRATKGINYPVGTLFLFNHDLLGVALTCRVTERSEAAPPSESISLTVEAERGISIQGAPIVAVAEVTTLPTGLTVLPRYKFVMPPAALLGESYLLIPLVARQDEASIAARVWLRNDDATQFQELGIQGSFATPGVLAQGYSSALGSPDDNSETLRLTLDTDTPIADLDRVTSALTEDEVRNNELLLWLSSAADPTLMEILSVRALRLVSGQWYAKVRRAQGGTTARTFSTGDRAWLIRKEELTPLRHESFQALADAGSSVTLRLQSLGLGGGEADLADPAVCPDLVVVLSPGLAPTPTGATATGTMQGVRLRWVSANDECSTEIYEATTSTPAPTAATAATVRILGNEHTRHGLTIGTTYFYWFRSVDVSGGKGAWTTGPVSATAQAVDVSYIQGQLANAQIESLAASKVTGQMTDAQVAALSAAKITGTLTSAQIADLAAAKLTGQITETQITNGSISSAKVAAGAIIAGKIAAGTIVAADIAANAITASRLAITPDNLNPDPFFFDTAGWLMDGGGWVMETIYNGGGGAGPSSGRLNVKGCVTLFSGNYTGTARKHVYRDFESLAAPGTTLRLSAKGRNAGNQSVYSTLQIFDAAMAYLAGVTIGWVAGSPASYTSASVVVPANARYYRTYAAYQESGTAWSGVAEIGDVRIDLMADASLIVDGAIIASKVATNAITAVKIEAGAIETAKLAAGAVTAAKITAGTITGNEIAANSVNADRLAANSITATKIAAGTITADRLAAGSIVADRISTQTLLVKNFAGACAVFSPRERLDHDTWITTNLTFRVDSDGYIEIQYAAQDSASHSMGAFYGNWFAGLRAGDAVIFYSGTYCSENCATVYSNNTGSKLLKITRPITGTIPSIAPGTYRTNGQIYFAVLRSASHNVRSACFSIGKDAIVLNFENDITDTIDSLQVITNYGAYSATTYNPPALIGENILSARGSAFNTYSSDIYAKSSRSIMLMINGVNPRYGMISLTKML